MKKRMSGFTLLELMIVIAIISVLAMILIPAFMRARAQSQLAACEHNEKNCGIGCELYANDNNGNYPTGTTLAIAAFTPNYMRQLPNCPINGDAYGYTGVTAPAAYSVYQVGSPHSNLLNVNTGFPEFCSQGGLRTQ